MVYVRINDDDIIIERVTKLPELSPTIRALYLDADDSVQVGEKFNKNSGRSQPLPPETPQERQARINAQKESVVNSLVMDAVFKTIAEITGTPHGQVVSKFKGHWRDQ